MYIFNQLVELIPTHHAELRMAQRNLSDFELEFALEYGNRETRNGYPVVILRACDIPDCLWHEFDRLAGITVIFCPQSRVIATVYRDYQMRHTGRRRKPEPKQRRSRRRAKERLYH